MRKRKLLHRLTNGAARSVARKSTQNKAISKARAFAYLKGFGGFWTVKPVVTDDTHHVFNAKRLFGEDWQLVRVELKPDSMGDCNVEQRVNKPICTWEWIDAIPLEEKVISC